MAPFEGGSLGTTPCGQKARRPFHGAQLRMATPVLDSALIGPQCGHAKLEVMPTDACLFCDECEQCKTALRPKAADCFVFCSHGSVQCPPVQMQGGCSSCSV